MQVGCTDCMHCWRRRSPCRPASHLWLWLPWGAGCGGRALLPRQKHGANSGASNPAPPADAVDGSAFYPGYHACAESVAGKGEAFVSGLQPGEDEAGGVPGAAELAPAPPGFAAPDGGQGAASRAVERRDTSLPCFLTATAKWRSRQSQRRRQRVPAWRRQRASSSSPSPPVCSATAA